MIIKTSGKYKTLGQRETCGKFVIVSKKQRRVIGQKQYNE